jgi:steroid Delta-isomerase
VSQGEQLLRDHVERFNAGVRSGDFGPMLEAFADDAEMAFEGVPAGPFHGRDAIEAAYRDQPPDDEIVLLDVREDGEGVVRAGYAWLGAPAAEAGEMRLHHADGRIERLVVSFASSPRASFPARRRLFGGPNAG